MDAGEPQQSLCKCLLQKKKKGGVKIELMLSVMESSLISWKYTLVMMWLPRLHLAQPAINVGTLTRSRFIFLCAVAAAVMKIYDVAHSRLSWAGAREKYESGSTWETFKSSDHF